MSALFDLVAKISTDPRICNAALTHDTGNAEYADLISAMEAEIGERLARMAGPNPVSQETGD